MAKTPFISMYKFISQLNITVLELLKMKKKKVLNQYKNEHLISYSSLYVMVKFLSVIQLIQIPTHTHTHARIPAQGSGVHTHSIFLLLPGSQKTKRR